MNARNEENNDHFLQLPNQNHFQENCLENKLNKEGHTIEAGEATYILNFWHFEYWHGRGHNDS